MSTVLSLRPSYYEALKRLTLELVGVNLGSDHTFLVETRLATLARKEGFESLNALIDDLFSQGQSRLAIKVVSALLERDTHFNPEPSIISQIHEVVVPNLMQQFPNAPIRILSFGCSSGQEPYSIAMQLDKMRPESPTLKFDIQAVDYPSPALDRAKHGVYTHFEVQRGLPIRDLVSYFDRRGEDWVVKPYLAGMVNFKEHHLLSSLSDLGEFHLIVFRNSLTRYASSARLRVMRSLSSILHDRGYLLLGSKDTIPKMTYELCAVEGAPSLMMKIVRSAENAEEDTATIIESPQERLTLIEKYTPKAS